MALQPPRSGKIHKQEGTADGLSARGKAVVSRLRSVIGGNPRKKVHPPLDTEALNKICDRVLIYVGTLFLLVAIMVVATSQIGETLSVPAVVPPLLLFTLFCFSVRAMSWPWSPTSRRVVTQLLWSVGLVIGIASSKLGAMYLINALPATLTAVLMFSFRVAALQLFLMIALISVTVVLRIMGVMEPLEARGYLLASQAGWVLSVAYLILIGVMMMVC